MEIRSFVIKNDWLIGASFSTGDILLVTVSTREVVLHVRFEGNCRLCFHLSPDGHALAACDPYSVSGDVSIWEASTGRGIATLPGLRASDIALASGCTYLVYFSSARGSRTYAYDLLGSHVLEMTGAGSPINGTWTNDCKTFLLPRWMGRGAIQASFSPFRVSDTPLPSKGRVWKLIANTNNDTLIMLEKDTVTCIGIHDYVPIWKRRVPFAGWITGSGDWRFIAVEQHGSRGGATVRTIVLDADSGERVGTIEETEQARHSLAGSRVLCISGKFMDLASGTLEPGVSDPDFWQRILGST